MVLHIGLDDTDGEKRMCTTYLATELIRKLSKDHDIIGFPRLVRLNPNIPWKTRGNGALGFSIGRGYGRRFLLGRIGKNSVFGFEKGKRGAELTEKIVNLVKKTVDDHAAFEDPRTNPAFVITSKRPPVSLYWSAVRRIVDLKNAKKMAKELGARSVSYKSGRGLIGALAATAWRPKDLTYEVLAYREKKRWGTKRKVDEESVVRMDQAYPSTFNNYDYLNNKSAIVPSSSCPVLFGIRGDEKDDLPGAMDIVQGEKKDRWMLFETNQGTDEHLVRRSISSVKPFESVIVKGKVCRKPETIPGGHVIFSIKGAGQTIDATPYEPSKQFRNVVWLTRLSMSWNN